MAPLTIAAAMLPFPNRLPDGSSVLDQPAEGWAETLGEIVAAGFDAVDPFDAWLPVADLSDERLRELRDVLADLGLGVPAVTTARRSVIDPEHGEANLDYGRRAADAAAALGASVLGTGLSRPLTVAQQEALWFWTAPGAQDPVGDAQTWQLAVERLRALARHCAGLGLQLSLELYEDTYLGSAESAVRLVHDVGESNVGLNPDLGNLVRLHRPMDRWETMAEQVVPLANFWHVKNYFRSEDATTGAVATTPAPLELGVIDYRRMLRMMLDAGFDGPVVCEHYGGDGLSVSATNRDHLRRLLDRRGVSR